MLISLAPCPLVVVEVREDGSVLVVVSLASRLLQARRGETQFLLACAACPSVVVDVWKHISMLVVASLASWLLQAKPVEKLLFSAALHGGSPSAMPRRRAGGEGMDNSVRHPCEQEPAGAMFEQEQGNES